MKPVTSQLEMKRGSSESQVLSEHRLNYALPSTGKILTSSQLVNHTPMLTTVTNSQPLQYRINSTTGFHDPRKSYLTGKMSFTVSRVGLGKVHTVTLAKGSIMNAIDKIMVKNAAGDIIMDERNVGRRKYFTNRYEKTEVYLNSVCGGMGFRTLSLNDNESVFESQRWNIDTVASPAIVVNIPFLIPLEQLGGIFAQDKLLPPYLTSGAIIELRFYNDAKEFFKFNATDPVDTSVVAPAFTVSENNLMLQTHMFNDSTMVSVKKEASRSLGIQMLYAGWESYEDSSALTNFNYQITKSVSNAVQAFAVVHEGDTVITDVLTYEKYQAVTTSLPTGLSWRLGSMNFPQAPYSDPSVDELLYATQSAFEQTSLLERGGMVRRTDLGLHVHAQSFKTTPKDVSGSPINLGRSLVVNFKHAAALPRDYSFFLKYQKLVRIFIDKSVVFE